MKTKINYQLVKIGIIGLGYVGLPLAVEFGKKFKTVGFDINSQRIFELKDGRDQTLEVTKTDLQKSQHLSFTDKLMDLCESNIFIITVPTPVDENKRPDFSPLISASRSVGGILKVGDMVIYESTVYPGATEEICIPEIESKSNLILNKDFYVGYSPERINPGDKKRKLFNIKKVTSGSNSYAADYVDLLYNAIIEAGTHKAPSIRIAEASKVIENTQRDVNIALINEFSKIFHLLSIDTREVLAAASSKWNFLPFEPGLVGGHCIGVDPYYLVEKSQSIGYYPDIILSCRRVNEGMGQYVANQVIKLLNSKGLCVFKCRVLIMGFTFKENCSDIRNTRVIDLIRELIEYGVEVTICDPHVKSFEAERDFNVPVLSEIPGGTQYDGIVIAVAHQEFRAMDPRALRKLIKNNGIIYDIKGIFPRVYVDGRL